jgi:phospholipid transport system substrate-binding protein
MKKFFCAVLWLCFALPALAAELPPDQISITSTEKILALLKANKDEYTKDHKKLYVMVDENILPNFDFRAMSRTVLGRYWRTATEEQRTQFVNNFRSLLVRTYATAMLKYNDEKIIYLPFKLIPGDRTATVKSEFRRADGAPPVAISYSFYRTDAGWKIYDVTIEGASLVTTYQTTYAERVQKEGLDALIAGLAKESKDAEAGKVATNGAKTSPPK